MKNEVLIKETINNFYNNISGKAHEKRDWYSIKKLFYINSQIMSVKFNENNECITTPIDIESYILKLNRILRKNDFYEVGYNYKVEISGHIANVYSEYEAKVSLESSQPIKTGINLVHLIKHGGQWKIVSMLWEDNLH